MPNKVRTIIGRKGADVATVSPTATLADAVALLAEHRIGALIVSRDGETIEGILSERDIVRQLAASGADTLPSSVEDVMTREVATCTWDTSTDELMVLMTEGRFRHVPVVEDGALVAIVSIGDVVKARMEELTLETDQLQAYVTGSY